MRAFIVATLFITVFACSCQSQQKPATAASSLKFERIAPANHAKEQLPVLVLLHGYGSNKSDLIPLVKQFSETYLVYAVQAPIELRSNSYAWYNLIFKDGHVADYDTLQFQKSLNDFALFLKDLKNDKLANTEAIYLFGFSQGGMMSIETVINYPELIKGAASVCGMLGATPERYQELKHATCNTRLFAANGTLDLVVPLDYARTTQTLFGKCAGFTYKEYACEHQITLEMLKDIDEWLQDSSKK